MGDRLGWAIFLLFLLVIDGQFTQVHESRNASCQSDCLNQENGELSCFSTPDPGCSALDPSLDDEVTQVEGPPVRVTRISVTPRASNSQYVVTLHWTSSVHNVQNSSRGLRVQWQALVPVPSDACTAGGGSDPQDMPASVDTKHCQILHFVHSPKSSTVYPTTKWCYTTNHPSRCHSITLSSLHGNVSLTITVRMPPNLTVIEDPTAESKWKTPVGIAIDDLQNSVFVVIQAAPKELNITSYKLTLVSHKDGSTIQEQILAQNETTYTFQQIKIGGVYVVRVQPLGPGCGIHPCQLSESAIIQLPGAPRAVLPALPSRSTVSAATASVPTPRPTSPTTTPNDMNLHKTTTATDPSVIVKPAVDQTEYTRSRKIILATVIPVVSFAIISTVIICICRRGRNVRQVGFPMGPFGTRGSNSSIMMEDATKNQPIVLLLYSYDCPAHEVVVTTFAYYLKEVANCEIILDIWDQHNLQEQGVYTWLKDKVDVAQFIILICSTGARFKCARNRQFRMKHDRTLPDVFAWGVDHVAEKIRTAPNVAEAKNRYVSAYFDYAGKSDIPPKLEITKKFCLMRDLYSLYCHLHSLKPGQSHGGSASKHGLTVDTYSKTEDGRPLQDALIDAKHFFKDNPNWLGQTLEAITPVLTASRVPSTENTPDEPARPKRVGPVPATVETESDPFLVERMKKRQQRDEVMMQRITHGNKESSFGTPGTSPSHAPSDSSSSVTSRSPLMTPDLTPTPRLRPSYHHAPAAALPSRNHRDMEEDGDADDTSQMQRDIYSIIHNLHAQQLPPEQKQNGASGHFFVDLDMGVYTPPEDFISLASLEEEVNRALAQSNPASPHRVPQSPAKSKTPSVGSGLQFQGVNSGSEPGSRGSPRRAAVRASSSSNRPSPAPSALSIGSPSKMNNHSGSGEQFRHSQSPVLTNSNPVSYSGSPQPLRSSVHMNHDTASRTSTSSPGVGEVILNSAPVSRCSTPRSSHSQPSRPLSPASSPSPPQSSSHSSSHSSPFKGLTTNPSHGDPKMPVPRQPKGSTNGHFVVDVEMGADTPTLNSNVS